MVVWILHQLQIQKPYKIFFQVLKLEISFWLCCCFGSDTRTEAAASVILITLHSTLWITPKSPLVKCSPWEPGRQSFVWEWFQQQPLCWNPPHLTSHSSGAARKDEGISSPILSSRRIPVQSRGKGHRAGRCPRLFGCPRISALITVQVFICSPRGYCLLPYRANSLPVGNGTAQGPRFAVKTHLKDWTCSSFCASNTSQISLEALPSLFADHPDKADGAGVVIVHTVGGRMGGISKRV